MKHSALIALLLPLSAAAVTPPRDIPFADKVCLATHVFVGTASDFKVVSDSGCDGAGDARFLTMCQEVQVTVTPSEVITPSGWRPQGGVTFRFGGGFFSIDSLREDLLRGPRYYFTKVSEDNAETVHRTSYPWQLGAEFTPENRAQVQEALGRCGVPNNSSKPTPLRGAA